MSSSLVATTLPLPADLQTDRRWLRTLAAIAALSVLAAVILGPLWRAYPLVAVGSLLFGAMFTGAGVILWAEPGHRRTAVLLIAAGIGWALGWSEQWPFAPLPLLSGISSYTSLSLAMWAMFRYPDPELTNRLERIYVALVALVLIGGIVATDLTMRATWKDYPADSWWITLRADPALNNLVIQVVSTGEVILAILFSVLWMIRIRRIRGLDRQLLTPMAWVAPAGTVAAVCVPVIQLLGVHGSLRDHVFAAQAAIFALVPVAFLVSVVRRRLADDAVLTLIHRVQQRPTPEAVQSALRTALLDDSLQVRYWAPELNTYVDVTGAPEHPPEPTGRLVLPVSSPSGAPLAVIDTDPALRRHPRVVTNAVAASGLALENAQLQAAVLARLSHVRSVRMQAVQAGAAERRRVERDLHDGAQQRLLALKLFLAASDSRNLADPARQRLRMISQEIARVLDELRELARGIHPALLSQAGLNAALEAAVQRQPIPVGLRLPTGRFPTATEETAYALILAVIQGAAEQRTGREQVEVRGHETGGVLTIEIQAATGGPEQLSLGAELPGMLDRVRALGGDVMISALAQGGSLLVAAIPCV